MLSLDFDFDAEGRANVAALDNAAAHPDVAGKIGCFERIVESAAARVADEGMIGAWESIVVAESLQVGDIFQLAGTVGSFAGEGPISCRKSWGAGGQPDDGRGNIFTVEAIADEEVGGGPRLGKVGDIGDGWVAFCGVGEQGVGIRRRRRNFELRSLLSASRFGGFGS